MRARAPVVLFGAFDRHNFGDLLFAHVAAAMLDGVALRFAGLAERDLRAWGGHRVQSVARLAGEWNEWGERPINVLHVGGEILDCDTWEAAVMLLPPEEARRIVARLDSRPRERLEWARGRLGSPGLAPYCLAPEFLGAAARVLYQAVGGAGLERREPAFVAEVAAKLGAADFVSVRDRHTAAQLAAVGVRSRLVPDSAVMVAECFGARIARHAAAGEVAEARRAFARGYLAVQFSADFGDDATLAQIACGLRRVTQASGLGLVLFRAGAAPWHDELACYERLAARLDPCPVRIFRSLGLWDICALVAQSRGYVGSSLHGRILAMAHALARVNLRHPAQADGAGKQAAFAATWEPPGVPATVAPAELADAVHEALGIERERLKDTARTLVAAYREGFEALSAALG